MIGRRRLPPEFVAWNRAWKAPDGGTGVRSLLAKRLVPASVRPRVLGPFSCQWNNETRLFEYPWAFHAVPVASKDVVDVGAGTTGFQFVLSRTGGRVVAVDPVLDDGDRWGVGVDQHRRISRLLRAPVDLRIATLQEAGLEPESVDTVYCLSTLEHLPADEAMGVMAYAASRLRPGGNLVLTVDLFLNLAPFSRRVQNEFGWNHDVRALVEASGLSLSQGDRSELYGFDEFDPVDVLGRLEELLVGTYPAVSQALVLTRPA
jgi:2-polyprenyl-3-methyl-5-hydroxy-6-metoxy-1,4-benzoquinol methylase